jgi:hypothetical protein
MWVADADMSPVSGVMSSVLAPSGSPGRNGLDDSFETLRGSIGQRTDGPPDYTGSNRILERSRDHQDTRLREGWPSVGRRVVQSWDSRHPVMN